jgi:hypothetical protein
MVGVSILQYACNMIIFMENNLQKALNMKLVLCILKKIQDEK